MNKMNRFYIILLLSLVTGPLSAQEWLSADDREAPMEERLMNKDYKVEINTDGYWKPLEVFGALTSIQKENQDPLWVFLCLLMTLKQMSE